MRAPHRHRPARRTILLPPDGCDLEAAARQIRYVGSPEHKALNQAVKRNAARFPEDFAFHLDHEDWATLNRSQTVTGSQKHRDPRVLPRVFTEHGAIMAATVLNSPQTVKMSLFVVRAFVKLREQLAANAAILKRLAEIDKSLLQHDRLLFSLWQQIQPLLSPPPAPLKREIGFHVKDRSTPYRTRLKASAAK